MNRIKWIWICFIHGWTSVFANTFVPAKYAGEFLSAGPGARPFGMGNAFSAVVQDITALYWNPAGLVFLDGMQIHGMHSERFSGSVNNDFIGLGISVGKKAALGIGLYRLGIDGIPVTRLKDPNRSLGDFYYDAGNQLIQNVPYVSGTLHDQEMALLFSYSRRFSAKWTWGGSVKMIRKQVGEYSAWGIGFDFGILAFPYRGLRIGMMLQDGTSTLIAWNGKRKELIVPHLKTGIAYPFQIRNVRLVPAVDFDVVFENRKQSAQWRMGSVSIDSHAGLELEFFKCIAFRSGMDQGRWTLGSGIAFSVVRVDYGFMTDTELGNSQRISATISLDPKWLP